jgi:hypothetical protein
MSFFSRGDDAQRSNEHDRLDTCVTALACDGAVAIRKTCSRSRAMEALLDTIGVTSDL